MDAGDILVGSATTALGVVLGYLVSWHTERRRAAVERRRAKLERVRGAAYELAAQVAGGSALGLSAMDASAVARALATLLMERAPAPVVTVMVGVGETFRTGTAAERVEMHARVVATLATYISELESEVARAHDADPFEPLAP